MWPSVWLRKSFQVHCRRLRRSVNDPAPLTSVPSPLQRWIAYQLLLALAQCHERSVCHGDIKAENVALTSWDWAFLVDFAPYKPTLLPADNPADFSFFFDTSGRRKCCLAPERFYDPAAGITPQQAAEASLTPAMVRRRGATCPLLSFMISNSPSSTLCSTAYRPTAAVFHRPCTSPICRTSSPWAACWLSCSWMASRCLIIPACWPIGLAAPLLPGRWRRWTRSTPACAAWWPIWCSETLPSATLCSSTCRYVLAIICVGGVGGGSDGSLSTDIPCQHAVGPHTTHTHPHHHCAFVPPHRKDSA